MHLEITLSSAKMQYLHFTGGQRCFFDGLSLDVPRVQCIVIVQSFLRLLKLHKLAVRKLDLLRGVLLGVTVC